MKVREKIEAQMNALGRQGRAFVFVIDFEGENAEIFDPGETDRILWQANGKSNVVLNGSERKPVQLDIEPVSFEHYKKGYDLVVKLAEDKAKYKLFRFEVEFVPKGQAGG